MNRRSGILTLGGLGGALVLLMAIATACSGSGPSQTVPDIDEGTLGRNVVDRFTESETTCVRGEIGEEAFDDLLTHTVVESDVWFGSFPMDCLADETAGGLSEALVAAAAGGLNADSRDCLGELYAAPDVLRHGFILSSDFGSNSGIESVGFMIRFLLCLEDDDVVGLAVHQVGLDELPSPSSLRCLFGRVDVEQFVAFADARVKGQLRHPSEDLLRQWEALADASAACSVDFIPPPAPTAEGRLLWRYRTSGQIFSGPVAAAGVVYVSAADGSLYAVQAASGDLVWRIELHPDRRARLTVADGGLYVSARGILTSVDPATGSVRWEYNLGPNDYSIPAIADGVVYVGAYGLYALDAATGELRWRHETEATVRSSPAAAGGGVFFGTSDDYLYAVDATEGNLRWRYQAESNVGSPIVVGNTVYAGSSHGQLHAVDAATGALRWRVEQGVKTDTGLAVAGDALYANALYTLDAVDAATGDRLWQRPVEGTVGSSPTVADGVVYIGSPDGHLYAVDAASGETLWRYRTGERVFSTPATADGVVYFGSVDEHLYALSTR